VPFLGKFLVRYRQRGIFRCFFNRPGGQTLKITLFYKKGHLLYRKEEKVKKNVNFKFGLF
jgi:hypothetical protein